jgi:hypothetical protein
MFCVCGSQLVLCGAFYPNFFEEVPSDEQLADREMSGYNPFTTVVVGKLENFACSLSI